VSALSLLEDLESRDVEAAARLADVDELHSQAEGLRERASTLLSFEDALPTERAARTAAVGRAEDALSRARHAREDAERELERAREKERAQAERALVEARADEHAAAEELRRAQDAAAALEHEAEQADVEGRELQQEALRTAERLASLPRLSHDATRPPGEGLAAVEEWSARARPALLLLRSALAAERDAIVREANEVGSAALGEPLGATSVRRVREQIAQSRA
jgi:chromosome segregation ATPase